MIPRRTDWSGPAGDGTDPLVPALHSAGPDPEVARESMLFGQFVGGWRLSWSGLDGTGTWVESVPGELHFGWVLGGRAVQDVWAVPPPGQSAPAGVTGFHGTTVRFYDRGIRAWRSTWIDPPNGRVRRFVGRPVDDDIELLSDEQEPLLRWRFTKIKPDSFHWTGEVRYPDRTDWVSHQRIEAVRLAG